MCAISFIIGFCLFLTALISDLEIDVNDLNTLISPKESKEIGNGELRQKFSTIIQFYLDAKMLVQLKLTNFTEFNDILCF